MASVNERFSSPRVTSDFRNSRVERSYTVHGTTNELEAKSLAMITAPAAQMEDGFLLDKVVFETESVDYGVWEVRATYTRSENDQPPEDPLQEGESTYEFDTTGNTTHITQSLRTVSSKFLSSAYSNDTFHGAIGVNQDRTEVAGVDIVLPGFAWSESHALPGNAVTNAYKRILYLLTGKINSKDYKGFKEGELLFLGARGTRRGDGIWQISYSFAASPNVDNVTIAGISGITKKGWQYLWFHYNRYENIGNLILRPTSAHVEDVYEEADFASLGIGS